MAVFVVAKTTFVIHYAMPQPLVSIQCLSWLFSTFKHCNNPCMLSKLVKGLHNYRKWNRITNCTIIFFNLIVFSLCSIMEHSLHLTIYILPLSLTIISAHGIFVAHVSWKLLFNSHSTFCFFLLLIGFFLVFLSIVKSIREIREIPRFDDIKGPQ